MDLIPFSLTEHCLESYFVRITSGSRIIYWMLILIVIAGISILPFVYVDVSVLARGYFQTNIEKQVIYTPFQGRVLFTSIKNGDHIEKGDTLLIIDSEAIRARRDALIQQIAENNASVSDLEILTGIDSTDLRSGNKELLTKRYHAELWNFLNQQAIQFQKYHKKKSEHERNELLFNQKIIPATDYENSLFILISEKDNIKQILLHQKSLWQSDLSSRRDEAVRLLADLDQCKEELVNRLVLAPLSGAIIQSTDIQAGSIVSQGQKILEISPAGELIANCFVKPSDIGLINENQHVRIQVDAFNYNEWGTLQADIIDISDDMIIENNSTAYFRIKCKPVQTFLSLKNGTRAYIKKGMSFNARIVVIRRSLFNLLFDKADKWFNPYTKKMKSE